MEQLQWKMDSVIGPLYLVASEAGLQGVHWDEQPVPMAEKLSDSSAPARILERTINQLDEYFRGRRKQFELPLAPQGTSFQKRVWRELIGISYGETISYKDLAKKIQNESASRAVGSANGKNPLCIVVPCHRVVASDGSLGGYSGGLDIKKRLLEIEESVMSQ